MHLTNTRLKRFFSAYTLGTCQKIADPCLAKLWSRCEASAFDNDRKHPVHKQVLRKVEEYFLQGADDQSPKVCLTGLPPLYFQHPGVYCLVG